MPPAAPSTVPLETIPPFSDIAFDDSGYATAIRFSKPIADPASLAEIRDSVAGRGRRGIAYLEGKLADLKSGDPATPATTANIQLLIGSLYMYEGEWAQASAHFSLAETADPARPALFRANMDALRGVAALRRGEVENCVACCNEASCVFPSARPPFIAAPPARGRRSSTSPATCGSGRKTWGCGGS